MWDTVVWDTVAREVVAWVTSGECRLIRELYRLGCFDSVV